MAEQYDNSGALFINDRKEKDNQPDYTGNVVINGEKKRLAGWKKTQKSDPSKTFLSLAISDYQEQSDQNPSGVQPTSNPMDDNLPF
tara:strand:+ start:723 stop:980 length:258 start_codon:yes stop_codon:yes gene_type:complete